MCIFIKTSFSRWFFHSQMLCLSVWEISFFLWQKNTPIIMKIVIMTISHWHVTKIIGCHFDIRKKNVFECWACVCVWDSACEFFPMPHCSNWIQLMWQEQIKQIKSYLNGSEGGYRKPKHIQFLCRQIDHTLTLSKKAFFFFFFFLFRIHIIK